MRAKRPTARDGFALPGVLWVLVVAAALAAEVHAGVRADQRVAANARAEARARWAARAGLARTVEALRVRVAAGAATGAGIATTDTLLLPVQTQRVDGVVVVARAVDARARLSLNHAAPRELRALLEALGWAPGRAAARAAAVDRWRIARLAAVQAPGDPVRPPSGPFAAVEALRAVPGWTRAEAAEAGAYLTVASDGRVNLNTAPVAVLRTLPGIGAGAAEAVAARRARRLLRSEHDVLAALGPRARRALQAELAAFVARAAYGPRGVEVRVTAAPPDTPVRARIRAVAVMAGGTRLPVPVVVER